MLITRGGGSGTWCSPCGLPSLVVLLSFWMWVLPFCSLYSAFFGCFGLFMTGRVSSVGSTDQMWPSLGSCEALTLDIIYRRWPVIFLNTVCSAIPCKNMLSWVGWEDIPLGGEGFNRGLSQNLVVFPSVDSHYYSVSQDWFTSQVELAKPKTEQVETTCTM